MSDSPVETSFAAARMAAAALWHINLNRLLPRCCKINQKSKLVDSKGANRNFSTNQNQKDKLRFFVRTLNRNQLISLNRKLPWG